MYLRNNRNHRKNHKMFLPTTKEELNALGWDRLDVILVTGDCYIDSPFVGVAVVGKVLLNAGYKVGVIGQPRIDCEDDIMRLGEPRLFWGVSAGSIDSMVANRTATGKRRRSDDNTPGGVNDKRPDRACIAYANLIRRFRGDETKPIVLGGIEASLRRVAQYDFATDTIRRSILFDAKADYLLYGMAEKSIVELADALKNGSDAAAIRGLSYISKDVPEGYLDLPSYDDCVNDKAAFITAYRLLYDNNDPMTARGLSQKHDMRCVIQNPPAFYTDGKELDAVYNFRFERDVHPFHKKDGPVAALETIRFAISTHRGCYGECNFCAIAVHEGRRVRSRSKESIIREAKELTRHPMWKGRIHDVGGPSANMYASSCERMEKKGSCMKKSCISPKVCPLLKQGHGELTDILKELRAIKGVMKVVVASGIRYDMVLADNKDGMRYLEELVRHHVSGQMKIAPEHIETSVLELMGKPGCDEAALKKFKDFFYKISKEAGLKQYLTYYLMAAHPGCTQADMQKLRTFALKELKALPEQVQVFTPTPSTYSTLMYYTGLDPFTNMPCFVEKTVHGKEAQKAAVTGYEKRAGFGARKTGQGKEEFKKFTPSQGKFRKDR